MEQPAVPGADSGGGGDALRDVAGEGEGDADRHFRELEESTAETMQRWGYEDGRSRCVGRCRCGDAGAHRRDISAEMMQKSTGGKMNWEEEEEIRVLRSEIFESRRRRRRTDRLGL